MKESLSTTGSVLKLQISIWRFLLCMLFISGMSIFYTKVNAQKSKQLPTFCNPIDLPYMFQSDGDYRSAADPVIVVYANSYWLFVSKNKGYYHSDDLVHWSYIPATGYPTDIFAPTVSVINKKLILTTGATGGMYTTNDPSTGIWYKVASSKRSLADPDTFLDDDGKLYLYDGCSDSTAIRVTALDTTNFQPIGVLRTLFNSNTQNHGWELPGNNNELKQQRPWIEGSWMNKIRGKYYLQYAGPGTQFSTYGDGLYIGDSPFGPFNYAPYSPFSFKPTGFITGPGHSCTFVDLDSDIWHVTTLSISKRHMFERRIGLFPTGVLSDGQLVTNTYLGDYPQYSPTSGKKKLNNDRHLNWKDNLTQWMLLSLHKPVVTSSTLSSVPEEDFKASNAVDENIRTWWSAAKNDSLPWMEIDLKRICTVNAIQINFADQNAKWKNEVLKDGYGYFVEISKDKKQWLRIIDHTNKLKDSPHDYEPLDNALKARFVRIVSTHSPANSLFSLYGLRIFGKAPVENPSRVKNVKVVRNIDDSRAAVLNWDPSKRADFYIVRYGIAPDKLWSNYQIYDSTKLAINSLNKDVDYYFSIDAVNGSGITRGKRVVLAKRGNH